MKKKPVKNRSGITKTIAKTLIDWHESTENRPFKVHEITKYQNVIAYRMDFEHKLVGDDFYMPFIFLVRDGVLSRRVSPDDGKLLFTIKDIDGLRSRSIRRRKPHDSAAPNKAKVVKKAPSPDKGDAVGRFIADYRRMIIEEHKYKDRISTLVAENAGLRSGLRESEKKIVGLEAKIKSLQRKLTSQKAPVHDDSGRLSDALGL